MRDFEIRKVNDLGPLDGGSTAAGGTREASGAQPAAELGTSREPL